MLHDNKLAIWRISQHQLFWVMMHGHWLGISGHLEELYFPYLQRYRDWKRGKKSALNMQSEIHWGGRGIAVPSLTMVLDRCGWLTPCPGCFTPGKEIRYPLCRKLGGPQGWHETCSHRRMNPGQSRELEPFELLDTTWPVIQYCTPDEWLHTWRTQHCTVPGESNAVSEGSYGM